MKKQVATSGLKFSIYFYKVSSGHRDHAWYVWESTKGMYLCYLNGRVYLSPNMEYTSGSIFNSTGWCKTRKEARRRRQIAKCQKRISC